jgi:hypothetical protein
VVVTHPFFKVPNLDMPTLEEVVRLGGMPEFGYCTVSPAWQYASPNKVAEAIGRVGASRCLLVSDTGQRHNPLPSEALRVFSQTLFEKGVSEGDIHTMIGHNPQDLLELDSAPEVIDDTAETWASAQAVSDDHALGDGREGDSLPLGTGSASRLPLPLEQARGEGASQ